MRLDGSIDALNMSRSESVSELNSELLRPRTSFGKDPEVTPTKPFGLGMLLLNNFSNVHTNKILSQVVVINNFLLEFSRLQPGGVQHNTKKKGFDLCLFLIL